MVRMSSTSRTRSPGLIANPRRNSRRAAPSSARTSSAKIALTPSWRPVSNARMTPPVVGPATRSTRDVPASSRWAAAQNAAQLAGRRRIGKHRKLLDVGVAVAAALEQEVALAEGSGPAKERLGSGGHRGARRCFEGWFDRRHGRYSTPLADGAPGFFGSAVPISGANKSRPRRRHSASSSSTSRTGNVGSAKIAVPT